MHSLIACGIVALALYAAPARGDDSPVDPRRIDAGRRVYAAQCAAYQLARRGPACMGSARRGGRIACPSARPRGPPWKESDAMLHRLVKHGWRDPYNKTQHLTMAAFGQTLSPREIRDVLDYLKTMRTPEQRRFQQEESKPAPFPPEAD
ncbi:c-type cytochrome [Cupriavidus basilensis]